MPNTHSTLTGLFTDIADAIREKDGSTGAKIADAFPAAIRAIPTGGSTDDEDALVTRTISEYTNPRVSVIGNYAFYGCSTLTTASFPACTTIYGGAFNECRKLASLFILASFVCNLRSSNALTNTPMANSTYLGHFGSIFVPASLVSAYKAATNWTYYAARITAAPEGI